MRQLNGSSKFLLDGNEPDKRHYMKFWNQRLTNKAASSFLLLSLVAVSVVGGVGFVKAREALKQAAFERLSVTATLKEEETT